MARKLNREEEQMFAEVIRLDDSAKVELSFEGFREHLLKRLETGSEFSPEPGPWFPEEVTRLPS